MTESETHHYPQAPLALAFYPDPVLRKKCTAYADDEFGPELEELAADLLKTMYIEGGVGLAAPQVSITRRMIAVDDSLDRDRGFVLVNPVIVAHEGNLNEPERCLSLPHPDLEANVKRHAQVTVEYRMPGGEARTIEGEELMARALQHEIDHLDGVLFIDHISAIKRMTLRKHLKSLEEQYG
jgi:peptide deformylase